MPPWGLRLTLSNCLKSSSLELSPLRSPLWILRTKMMRSEIKLIPPLLVSDNSSWCYSAFWHISQNSYLVLVLQQGRQQIENGQEIGSNGSVSEQSEEELPSTSSAQLTDDEFVKPDHGPPKRFRNRFLGLIKLRSNIAEAAESLFKSEIRRRICVTIILLMASRAGYFIPLPGFDRRSMPGDYLGFVSGAVGEHIINISNTSINYGKLFRCYIFILEAVYICFPEVYLAYKWRQYKEA